MNKMLKLLVNNEFYHRRSIRLEDYDYTLAGAYFITLCTFDRKNLFGNIIRGEMKYNDAGKMVQRIWSEIPKFYSKVDIDEFIIMPNHVHGIIILVGADYRVCPKPLSLPDVIQRFKSLTTTKYRNEFADSTFTGKLWQRNYYEHIIRNEKSLNLIREYIFENPRLWESDRENPMATLKKKREFWEK